MQLQLERLGRPPGTTCVTQPIARRSIRSASHSSNLSWVLDQLPLGRRRIPIAPPLLAIRIFSGAAFWIQRPNSLATAIGGAIRIEAALDVPLQFLAVLRRTFLLVVPAHVLKSANKRAFSRQFTILLCYLRQNIGTTERAGFELGQTEV